MISQVLNEVSIDTRIIIGLASLLMMTADYPYWWYFIYYVGITVYGTMIGVGPAGSACAADPIPLHYDYEIYFRIQFFFYHATIYRTFVFDKDNKNLFNWGMILHHVVTFSIIWISGMLGFMEVAHYVLMLHDVGDICLFLTNIFKESNGKDYKLTQTAFVLFTLSFFYDRLYRFPLFIAKCYTTAYGSWLRSICVVGMAILYCLHLYWGKKIVSIWWKIFNGDR
jgi:hypothetical protein